MLRAKLRKFLNEDDGLLSRITGPIILAPFDRKKIDIYAQNIIEILRKKFHITFDKTAVEYVLKLLKQTGIV